MRERERERDRDRERERTVKLNPNTPSHAIQNTVARGNTFTTHERRNILPNVGLQTVDLTDCYKFLWSRSVFFWHISLLRIQIHSLRYNNNNKQFDLRPFLFPIIHATFTFL